MRKTSSNLVVTSILGITSLFIGVAGYQFWQLKWTELGVGAFIVFGVAVACTWSYNRGPFSTNGELANERALTVSALALFVAASLVGFGIAVFVPTDSIWAVIAYGLTAIVVPSCWGPRLQKKRLIGP